MLSNQGNALAVALFDLSVGNFGASDLFDGQVDGQLAAAQDGDQDSDSVVSGFAVVEDGFLPGEGSGGDLDFVARFETKHGLAGYLVVIVHFFVDDGDQGIWDGSGDAVEGDQSA